MAVEQVAGGEEGVGGETEGQRAADEKHRDARHARIAAQ
jgi:hypothetical protein